MSKHEDYDDYNNAKQTFIVKDEKAALKMKREEARAAREKYKAVVAREREEKAAERAIKRNQIQLELTKLKLSQSASEKARTNIALTTPALLVLLIGGFIAMLGTGSIPDDQVSVASAFARLVCKYFSSINLAAAVQFSTAPGLLRKVKSTGKGVVNVGSDVLP